MSFKSITKTLLVTLAVGHGVAQATQKPMLVILGGNDSCVINELDQFSPYGMHLDPFAQQALDETLERYDSHTNADRRMIFKGCFDKYGNIYFTEAGSDDSYTIGLDAISEFAEILKDNIALHGNPPVFFIGHSYGGWLAAKIIEKIGSQIDTRGLFTIDPISPYYCSSADYLYALSLAFSNWGEVPEALQGCREAPRDMDITLRRTILDVLGVNNHPWMHYYQLDFTFLHSSKFPGRQAQPTSSVDYSEFLYPFNILNPAINAHTRIIDLEILWYSITQGIQRELGFEILR